MYIYVLCSYSCRFEYIKCTVGTVLTHSMVTIVTKNVWYHSQYV
jgi:hypothetical protein